MCRSLQRTLCTVRRQRDRKRGRRWGWAQEWWQFRPWWRGSRRGAWRQRPRQEGIQLSPRQQCCHVWVHALRQPWYAGLNNRRLVEGLLVGMEATCNGDRNCIVLCTHTWIKTTSINFLYSEMVSLVSIYLVVDLLVGVCTHTNEGVQALFNLGVHCAHKFIER